VGQAAHLQLESLTITGAGLAEGEYDQGLVEVEGTGATADMDDCEIRMKATKQECGSCVLVAGGASASLHKCHLANAAGHGLLVTGRSSKTVASECTARQCQGSGFSSTWGGHLT
jgi:hypothetical protein